MAASTRRKSFRWPGGRRAAVSLTFDDARPSQLDHGIPVLDRHGIKGTFFANPDRVKQRHGDWRRALDNGHEIANHTMTHPCSGNFPFARKKALEDMTLEQMAQELDSASAALETLLGVRPRTFAYTCGNSFVGRGANHRSYVPLVAERFVVGRDAFNECANDPLFCDLALAASLDADRASLSQIERWIDQAVETGGWVIFMAHDVFPALARQSISVKKLGDVCRLLAKRREEIWTDTVLAVGEYIAARQP